MLYQAKGKALSEYKYSLSLAASHTAASASCEDLLQLADEVVESGLLFLRFECELSLGNGQEDVVEQVLIEKDQLIVFSG